MSQSDASGPHSPEGGHQLNPQEIDELFDLLQNFQRRCLLDALAEHKELSFDALVDEVIAREQDANNVSDVRTTLFHSHLPRLVDANIVHCDRTTETVSLIDDSQKWALIDRFRTEIAGGKQWL